MNRQDAKEVAKSAKKGTDLTAEDAEDAETEEEGRGGGDGCFAVLRMAGGRNPSLHSPLSTLFSLHSSSVLADDEDVAAADLAVDLVFEGVVGRGVDDAEALVTLDEV